jgi:hypothetical protein
MSLQITTIAHSISVLSIAGVKVFDLHSIPEGLDPRSAPALFPKPDGFITGLKVERDSMGLAATAQKTASYTLHYVYCHSLVGEGRGLFDVYPAVIANIALILDTVIANDTLNGAVDISAADVSSVGPVTDPAGAVFHGCEFAFDVMEYIN